jgi:parvulin-like peptidyl-prolyl isomerase
VVASLLPGAWAAETPAPDEIVARVDDVPIYRRELERELSRVLQGRKVEESSLPALRRQTLNQLIDRRLVLRHLQQSGLAASPQEIDREIRRMEARLQRQQVKLEDYLKQAHLTRGDLAHLAAWDIGWQRFLERYLTDENLARYFEQHRRDFDGTELLVAHVLFRVEPPGDQRATDAALAKAKEVRQQIAQGELTFAEAAQRFSAAPTAADGGRIGFIGRRAPMPEAFSQAAFALEKGQLSAPVLSPFGVHLIQCLEIKAGQKTWQDVRGELEPAVTQHLFRWAADQQRPHAKIEAKSF